MPHTWYQLQAAAMKRIMTYSFLFRYSSMLELCYLRLFTPIFDGSRGEEMPNTGELCGPIPLFNGRGIALAKSMNLPTSSSCLNPRAVSPFSSAMSLPSAYAAQCCARTIRASSRTNVTAPLAITQRHRNRRTPSRRWESTASAVSATNPKIATIVDQISQLTLLETADLVYNLKVSLHV